MADPDRQIWDGMLSYLRTSHPTICRQWFSEIEPLGVVGGAMNLRAQSAVHRDYLRRSCADAFNDASRTVSGRLLPVRFLGPEDDPEPQTRPSANGTLGGFVRGGQGVQGAPGAQGVQGAHSSRGGRTVREDSLALNPDYSFENFIVGTSNRLAHAAAVAVASNPGRTYNPFFVHGGVGLGKTHLLQAVCLRIREHNPDAQIYYISCEAFITQFIDAVQIGEMADFRHRFRDVDVLIIDDIQFLAQHERTQEEFFHTFNSLYQSNRQIVMSSDSPPEQIPDLEERLVSRFKWGLVAKVDAPDLETRIAILKTKARVRGFSLPDDVASYVATEVTSNIRELEGAITKLQIQAAVDNRDIDIELARSALGIAQRNQPGEPPIQMIITRVSEFYGVKLTDLQSKRRHRSVAMPRQVCMYLARKHTRHSLEEIGGYLGGRDHTTVMHAIRKVEELREAGGEFQAVLKDLEDKIKPTKP